MAKPPGYYDNERFDMLSELPKPLGHVLDIGCGHGGSALSLRSAGADRITGIEIVPEVARQAAALLDDVQVGDASVVVDKLKGPFDTILCYDVLEHLARPDLLLTRLVSRASSGATLHVSMPNARYYGLVRDLAMRGTFGYSPSGHRDDTHLRWYTPADGRTLLTRAGWEVERTRPLARFRRTRPLIWVTAGRASEFFSPQWGYLARKPE
jgi:trans-aconitate methyltransferase